MFSSVFRSIATFEFRYQLKSPVFIVVAALFFLLSFGNVVSDNVQLAATGNVNVNSPDAITQVHLIMSLIALFVVTAFMANVITRDYEYRCAETLFSTQLRKSSYLLGRFCGAYLVSLLALCFVSIGMYTGSLMPAVDADRLGPQSLSHYFYILIVVVAPNVLFAGALSFSLATISRSLLWAYVGIVAFILLYAVSQSFLDQPDLRYLASLLDPFGASAYQDTVRYWTAFERNQRLVPLEGIFLINRLLWLSVSIVLLVWTYWRFQLSIDVGRRFRFKRTQTDQTEEITPIPLSTTLSVLRPSVRYVWRQFLWQVIFDTKWVLASIPFIVLVVLAVMSTYFSFASLEQIFGTPVYPVTRVMTNIMQGTFTLSLLIVVIYYGAELVWRDDQCNINEIIDSAPVPSWIYAGAKAVALLLVVVILLLSGVLTAVLAQWSKGYYEFEWQLYLTRHLLDYGRLFYCAAILSIFVQTLVRSKFTGMAVMVAYVVVVLFVLDAIGFEDPLYQFGARADVAYSDMNGWGHFAEIAVWYGIYWGSAAVLLYIASHALWRRGTLDNLVLRLRHVNDALGTWSQITAITALLIFLSSGGYIFYNTHVLNEYMTEEDLEHAQINYEKKYIQMEQEPQARIIAVNADVDIFPDELRYRVKGQYRLINRHEEELNQIALGFHPLADVQDVSVDGGNMTLHDEEFNYFVFELENALGSGEEITLNFVSGRHQQGFKHARNNAGALGLSSLNGNGSFIFNNEAFPYLGFNRDLILQDRHVRKTHGMEPVARAADLEDVSAYGNSYLRQDSDWIDFETRVSTKEGQIAIAPGYLVSDWVEGGRHYFHYKMDAPMQNLFAYLSADYERAYEHWNGIDLEIYYHRPHAYNVEKMLTSVKRSLAYFSENFSPYQYRQMRVLEFPVHAGRFAVSFPNTVPWSEGLGFIANVEDEQDIDYVFYVGAHEVAHQWWGHQVSSANVQGQTMLVETLAQYSALMVMEEEYGPHLMRRFLKYELDNYLSNRGNEAVAEKPLYRVENQPYIHYRKGSLVMYALQDYLGKERVNEALASFIKGYAYQYQPYPNAINLIDEFKAVSENEQEYQLIKDLFERIIIWDLEMQNIEVTERADGLFDVALSIEAAKLESDGLGQETERELYMPIDIGIFSASPDSTGFDAEQVIYLSKEMIISGSAILHLTVDQRPTHAGIDPYNKLIDRNAEDNLRAVDTYH